jgi:hypothetical protein
MKKGIVCWVFIAVLFGSCGERQIAFEKSTPDEQWEVMRDYMVPGAPVSDERPLPNVLSEREVLLKVAEAAVKEGVLHPSYYAYENNPALTTAKIETPILMFNLGNGVPDRYIINAVDTDGITLAFVSVRSARDANGEPFEFARNIVEPNAATIHMITKREAAELIQNQFPDNEVSEPMLISNLRLGDAKQSHREFFWYFTVSDNARSAAGEAGEYIISADVGGYSAIPGRMSNRVALNKGDSPYLNGLRMAKLDTPLHLFDKLGSARAAGGVTFTPSMYPEETVDFTPLPLK